MDYLATIRQHNFTKLWLAQILSQVAQNLLNFALIILVFDLTASSKFGSFAVSMVVLAFSIPSILFAPAAGTYVDFFDRKWVLVISNVLRTLLVLLYIPFDENLILILLLTFVTSTVTQFFVPAEAATIPKVVPPKYLLTANSLFIFSLYAAFVVGYSASGPVVNAFGEFGPFYVTALMFGLASLLVSFLPRQPRERQADHLPKLHIINQLRENWRIITEKPERHFAAIQLAVTQGVIFVLITLAPALSLALLKVPLKAASHVVIVPVGIGMIMGVLLVNHVTKFRSKMTVIQMGLIVASASLILVGLTGQLYRTHDGFPIATTGQIEIVVALLMLLLGVINALVSASAQTLLQETTDDANRGKVFGSLNLMVNVAATAPIFIAGILADTISVTKVVTLMGGLLLAYAIWMTWHYRRSVFKRVAKAANTKTVT